MLDKSLCSPRDLSESESTQLRELLREQLDINPFKDQDHEDAEVLLDYAFDMIESGDSVGKVTEELVFMEMSVCNETVADELGVCLAQFFHTLDDNCSKTSDSAEKKEDKSKKDDKTVSQAQPVEKSGEEKRFRTSLQQRRAAFQQKHSLPSHQNSAEAIKDMKHRESTCETVLSTDDDNSSIDTLGSVCDDDDDITVSCTKQCPNFKQSSSKPTTTEAKQVSGPVLSLDKHSYIAPTVKEKKVSKSELLNSRLLYLQRRVNNVQKMRVAKSKADATQPSSSFISSYNKNTVDSPWIKHR